MDFFSHQQRAKSRTGFFLCLFGLAVVGAAFSAYLFIFLLVLLPWNLLYAKSSSLLEEVLAGRFEEALSSLWSIFWYPEFFWGILVVALLSILIGGFVKWNGLRERGGEEVVRLFSGRYLEEGTQGDLLAQQLLNIVSEMAVASGVVKPRVYLLEGMGINAFAAGISPNTAVVGVTEGALRKLTREELQAVIAHEFSHIVNGDMFLNLRLGAALTGLLVLKMLGFALMRVARGRAALFFVLGGLGFVAAGAGGGFFALLIQRAISREREFLADAAAVQFTRNGKALCSALWKAKFFGSKVSHSDGGAFSHLFFGEISKDSGNYSFFRSLFCVWTHPSLEERIRRVDPSFLAHAPVLSDVVTSGLAGKAAEGAGFFASTEGVNASEFSGLQENDPAQDKVFGTIKETDSGPRLFLDWVSRVDPLLYEAAGSVEFSSALLLAAGGVSLDTLSERASKEMVQRVEVFKSRLLPIPPEDLYPLLDLCLSSARRLGLGELRRVKALMDLGEEGFPEQLWDNLLSRYIVRVFLRARIMDLEGDYLGLQGCSRENVAVSAQVVFSGLLYWGGRTGRLSLDDLEDVRSNYARVSKLFLEHCSGIPLAPFPLRFEECGLEQFDDALFFLRGVGSEAVRKAVFDAALYCIDLDGRWTALEAGLVLALGAVFDYPVPLGRGKVVIGE